MANKIPQYADELERKVGKALSDANIKFIHDSQGGEQRLDFYLPEFNLYIEVKKYHSDRISGQLLLADNIIVLQGERSVIFFINMLIK